MKSYLPLISTIGVIFLFLFLLVRIMWPFLSIFVAAGIFAILLSPIVDYLTKRFGWDREISSLITLTAAILVLAIPVSILVTLLASEVADLIKYKNWLTPYLADPRWQQEINNYSSNILRFLSSNVTNLFSRTFGVLIDLLLTVFVANFFLSKKSQITKFLIEINPLKHEDAMVLTSRATEVIVATVRGYLSTMLLQMAIGLSGFLIFGVPSPVLFGITYGLASIVPMVGIALVWIPAAIYLIIVGKTVVAAGLVIWCLGLNIIMDNVVSPKLVAGGAKLHPLAVLFGVLGGIEVFGIFGIILGPVIVALSFTVLDMYKKMVKP